MPLPLIVSLPRRIKGLETLSHFVIIDGNTDGGYRCLGPDCGTYLWDRLSPVELADGGEIDQDETGDCSPLCRPCSFRTSARIAAGSGWSGLETSDISALWRLVSAEQARDLELNLIKAGRPIPLKLALDALVIEAAVATWHRANPTPASPIDHDYEDAEGVLRELKAHAKKVEGRK